MKLDDIVIKALLAVLGFVVGAASFAIKVDAKASAWEHDKPYFQEEMREMRADVRQLLNDTAAIKEALRRGRH